MIDTWYSSTHTHSAISCSKYILYGFFMTTTIPTTARIDTPTSIRIPATTLPPPLAVSSSARLPSSTPSAGDGVVVSDSTGVAASAGEGVGVPSSKATVVVDDAAPPPALSAGAGVVEDESVVVSQS